MVFSLKKIVIVSNPWNWKTNWFLITFCIALKELTILSPIHRFHFSFSFIISLIKDSRFLLMISNHFLYNFTRTNNIVTYSSVAVLILFCYKFDHIFKQIFICTRSHSLLFSIWSRWYTSIKNQLLLVFK